MLRTLALALAFCSLGFAATPAAANYASCHSSPVTEVCQYAVCDMADHDCMVNRGWYTCEPTVTSLCVWCVGNLLWDACDPLRS